MNNDIIGSDTKIVKLIASGTHKISEYIKKSKKPIVIIGESALHGDAGGYIFETFKKFYTYINHILSSDQPMNKSNQLLS